MVSLAQIRGEDPSTLTAGCPSRTVIDHVMSKWGVLVLLSLAEGTRRWGELRREVEGISEKMLGSTLRTLTADGLVLRRSFPEVPPRVEYELTERGRELMSHLGPLVHWIVDHAHEMVGTTD